jgi:hypothetical protein
MNDIPDVGFSMPIPNAIVATMMSTSSSIKASWPRFLVVRHAGMVRRDRIRSRTMPVISSTSLRRMQ